MWEWYSYFLLSSTWNFSRDGGRSAVTFKTHTQNISSNGRFYSTSSFQNPVATMTIILTGSQLGYFYSFVAHPLLIISVVRGWSLLKEGTLVESKKVIKWKGEEAIHFAAGCGQEEQGSIMQVTRSCPRTKVRNCPSRQDQRTSGTCDFCHVLSIPSWGGGPKLGTVCRAVSVWETVDGGIDPTMQEVGCVVVVGVWWNVIDVAHCVPYGVVQAGSCSSGTVCGFLVSFL